MTASKHFDLINRAIDGEITSEEKEQLKDLLESNPELQQQYDDLMGLAGALNKTEQVEPPAEMKQNIMTAVRSRAANKAIQKSAATGFMASIRQWFTLPRAVPFAAGVAVGAVALMLMINSSDISSPVDNSQAVGTLLDRLTDDSASDPKHLDFEAGEINGNLDINRGSNKMLANIHITSAADIDILLKLDEQVRVDGFMQVEPIASSINIETDNIRISHKGVNEYLVSLSWGDVSEPSIRFQIFSDTLLYEVSLTDQTF